ncbi:MAG: hypothetical protein LC676_19015 [Loktanella sp.]|nr:hypothetical protein [Loktanella sp.]
MAIAIPPEEGQDFNDLLQRDGAKAIAALIEDAEAVTEAEAVLQIGQHRPVNYQGSGEAMPTLRADEGDLGRSVSQAWSVIMASNRTPWVYRFAGQPTWVVPDDEGRPVATMLNEERLRHMLARLARWVRENAKGELLPAPPPIAVVKSVLATPDPALPVLTGIVNTPVFGRTGTLITTPGYHPDARLLYVPAPGFTVPDIPKRPSAEDIAAARRLICDDLFGDFPFTGEAERAHVVALLLLGFMRAMIDGPTPLHLIEKPTPGTGATLMVDAIATILTGTGASVMTEGRDDEEWRKRVTAKLRQIPSIILIDKGHWAGDRKQTTLWQIPSKDQDAKTVHGIQKPVECMRRPIENNSNPGQAIYEPFMGSGTTLIAAEMSGRICFGIELNPAYVDVAIQRWQDFTGETAVLDSVGRTFAEVRTERLGDAAA